jgi:23S rRNA (guanosine2251-2'-O)-methyltransferase
VRELLLAGRRQVREVLVAGDPDRPQRSDDIAELAESLGVSVERISPRRLAAVARSEAPQGVVALAAPVEEALLDDLAAKPFGTPPFLVMADGITDPGNLGALLRSAECAGATGAVLPRHRAVHLTPAATKSAAGAVEHLPIALVGGLASAISRLRELGVWVIGLDAGGDSTVFEVDLDIGPVALVLGSEGAGLSRLVRQRCDAVVSIPLAGRTESLNVAAAGAVACFEVARQRGR